MKRLHLSHCRFAAALAAILACAASPAVAQRNDTVTIALPGVTAQSSAAECTIREDPGARALWERVRARYSTAGDTVSLWTVMTSTADWVRAERLLRFDTTYSQRDDGSTTGWDMQQNRRDAMRRLIEYYAAPRSGRGGRGMSGVRRASLSRGITWDGYARLQNGLSADLTGAFAGWEYPPLDAELASHFISDEFGRRNVMAIVVEQGKTAIAFCGARPFRSQPYLSGMLVLRADTTLERALWSFRTPSPNEQAGGQAEFAGYDASGGLPLLVAARGVFYRRHAAEEFYQRQQLFDGGKSASRAAIPDEALTAARRALPRPVPILRRATQPGP